MRSREIRGSEVRDLKAEGGRRDPKNELRIKKDERQKRAHVLMFDGPSRTGG
jgi:hypothetical protein